MLAKHFAVISMLLIALAVHAADTPSHPCSASQQKQFDFWVGDWQLTWPGEKPGTTARGANHIVRILNNCVVQENFDGGADMALQGTSVSTFDVRSGKWKQTWVDNEGGYLDFVGEWKDGQMILAREGTAPDGAKILQRMVWKNIGQHELDWSWEASRNGGKTWEVRWPIHYRRAH
jgi:hypothetical protein